MTSTKDRLLDAAEAVTTQKGTSRLTLDLVASTAKTSKGGLLYHFPSKPALIQAMLERKMAEFWQRFDQQMAEISQAANPTLRSLIALCRSLRPEEWDLHAALAVGLSEDPKLLIPVQSLYKNLWDRIEAECGDPTAAYAIWSAVEGQTYFRLLSLDPITFDQRDNMFQYLEQLVNTLPAKGDAQ
mgnify:CR=1 FL=1